jgi:hypothetical protein
MQIVNMLSPLSFARPFVVESIGPSAPHEHVTLACKASFLISHINLKNRQGKTSSFICIRNGLFTAFLLAKAGIKVAVFEANDEISQSPRALA